MKLLYDILNKWVAIGYPFRWIENRVAISDFI